MLKFQIDKGSVRFFVNKDKRTVVCLLKGHAFKKAYFDLSDRLEDFLLENMTNVFAWQTAEGKAVCAEEDEFDETVGKQIAYRKAQAHCCRMIANDLKDIIGKMDAAKANFLQDIKKFDTISRTGVPVSVVKGPSINKL